ncbi:MAG: Flagellar hook-length control protein FliK [Clostridia bacterium]|nr:Flagellar hook-length control protein FliK [Clostridia bacterium]
MRITTQNQMTIKPQLADFLSNLEVGDTVKGKLIEMLGQSISIKTASGQIFTAALMKAADLNPGQLVELNISSISTEGIFAELKADQQKPQINDDAKLQQLLKQMDIKPEESHVQAAKLLIKYNMPVTKENVMKLVNTQKSMESLAQGDSAKAIALLQSELNINNTEITKLVKMAAVLEPQSQQLLKELDASRKTGAAEIKPTIQNEEKQADTVKQVPLKQGEVQKPLENNPKAAMQQLAAKVEAEVAEQGTVQQVAAKQDEPKLEKLIDTIAKVFETASQAKPEQAAYMISKDIKITPAAVKAIIENTTGENKLSKKLEGLEKLVEALEKNQVDVKEIKQELKKLFLKPELLQDKEKAAESFKDILKLGGKLETLIKEQGLDSKLDTSVLQDIKGNMDFIKSINANINYLQIPIQMNEKNTTAEIYVFNNKKRSKSVNPENATILIALDLDKLGHIESLISVNKKNVDVTIKVEKEDFKKVISNTAEALRKSLEARGYSLNLLKLIDIQEKFNLLELEELIRVDSEQLHVDIKV